MRVTGRDANIIFLNIAYSLITEFKVFIEGVDKELWNIFHSVDKDSNGKIDKTELHEALERAGIAANGDRLQQFFEFMDRNRDGVISFEEWRYKLLILHHLFIC